MSVIHQLYCTHCTYRTSALHRREDSIGDQVFEYSTRAGSVPREKSHDVFRLIESVLYFHLPGDTPQTEFMRFTANTSPRRLFFLPAISGTRVVAHVCYRQTDTRGRPGSYFAHVFSSENKSGATWSALDAIMLWGSPHWITEDSANHPYDLPAVESLTTIPGHGAHVNDNVLRSFLTTPANGFFNDPGNVIPPQWRERDTQQRRQLLIDLLSAALLVEPDRHEKVWLAAEESLAALLFFGVFRLLPPKGLIDKLSFSTFESHIDRPAAVLVATLFHKPETDFSEDAYRGRGAVINTFNGRRSPALRPAVYAAMVIQKLLAPDGSRLVNELLQRLAEANVTQGKDLEQLLAAEDLIPQIVSPPPGVIVTERQLPSGREPRKIVQRGVIKALCAGSVVSPHLRQIAQSPERVSLLIELLSGAELPEANVILQQLLQFIPADDFIRLMPDKRISKQLKINLLAKIVHETKSLPPGYDSLWSSRPELGWPDKMLEGLFSQLSNDDIQPLLDSALTVFPGSPAETMDRLKTTVGSLLSASANDPTKRELLSPIVDRAATDPSRLQALLLIPEIGAPLVSQCGLGGPIESCLRETLQQLPRDPARFVDRLRLLQLGQKLPLGEEWQSRFNAWQRIRQNLSQLDTLLQNRPGRLVGFFNKQHQQDLESNLQGLLADAPRTLTADDFPNDYSGRDRAQLLKRIVNQLVPSELPADFFDLEQFAAAISRRPYQVTTPTTDRQRPRSKSGFKRWTATAIAVIALTLVVGVFGWTIQRSLIDKSDPAAKNDDEATRKKNEESNRTAAVTKDGKVRATNAAAARKKEDEEQEHAAAARKKKGDDERAAEAARREEEEDNRKVAEVAAEKLKDEDKKRAIAAAAETVRKRRAALAANKPNWPPKFLTLPPGDSPELKQICPWSEEPGEPIALRGIEELNKHLETFVGDQPRPMFVVGKDTIGSADRPLIVNWAAKRPADESPPAGTVELCRFQKTAEGLYFRWNHPEGDSLHKARQMLRLCCLEVGQGDLASVIPLLPDAELLANWDVEYQDNAAHFSFKPDLPGTNAFAWFIRRGTLHLDHGDPVEFQFPDIAAHRGVANHEVKWPDSELAERFGVAKIEFACKFDVKPTAGLQLSLSSVAKATVSDEQKKVNELAALLRKILNKPNKPYKDKKGKATDKPPNDDLNKLDASDLLGQVMKWESITWLRQTEDMEIAMIRLSPGWKKPERPKPLDIDPKWEPTALAAAKLEYLKKDFIPWFIREMLCPALKVYQSKLDEKQADADKAKSVQEDINRVEIKELVRYVNQRPVVVLSPKDRAVDAK